MRPASRKRVVLPDAITAGRLCLAYAAGALGLASGLAMMPASAQSLFGGNDEPPRLRPYVIETPREEREYRRPPSNRAKARDERDNGDEAVPTPRPVHRGSSVSDMSAAAAPRGTCNNPNALGVSREVEIDTTGGPRYGFQQYKLIDFLKEGEIVLTFDDGPIPAYTKPILQALSHHCTKGTFFIVGRNALSFPEVVKDTAARGHTIANHTWSHANLGMRKIVPKRTQQADAGGGLLTGSFAGSAQPQMTPGSIHQQPTFAPALTAEKAKAEIELGFSATARALGVPMAPFFRFPYLGYSTVMHNYLTERNVAVFSIDVDSVDYRAKRADDVIQKTMRDLGQFKKGILLFHDIQPATAQAMPALLDLLKAKGYKVVHIKAKAPLQTIAAFDARVGKDGVKMDAVAENKPLVKRTMTWGMDTGGGAAVAAQASDGDPARRAKKPVVRSSDRTDNPGYSPARTNQPEVLPWQLETRRNGW